ncbi:MAG: AMP-dependent synthetase/ligase [Myxococcota bacterium]
MDTRSVPDMLDARIAKTPDIPALKSRMMGKWRSLSFREFGVRAKDVSLGLMALGMGFGDKAAILAKTREEWMIADFGIMGAGGVTVPIYPSNLSRQCRYIINNSGARFVFADDSSQLKKLYEERDSLSEVAKVILFSGASQDEWVMSYEALLQLGRGNAEELEGEYKRRRTELREETPATIIYTSGTMGEPKGATLPHRAFTVGCPNANKSLPIGEGDEQLLFLPLAHSFAKMLSVVSVHAGVTIAFAENGERAINAMTEVNPTFMAAVPRVFEKVHQRILSRVENSSRLEREIFRRALAIGYEYGGYLERREKPPFVLEKKYKIADEMAFKKIRKRFGKRLKWFISGGAPLSEEIARFFHSLGILILEGYGMTENNSITSVNRVDFYKFGTVGRPHVGVEVRIGDDGEILQRGASNMLGYFNDPEGTAEAIDADGWLHTGDIGEIDGDGFIKITDRKKDIIVTAGGKNVSPQYIENILKSSPYISNALVYGDKRKYLVALITLDENMVRDFAMRRNLLSSGDFSALASKPEVHALIEKEVEEKNKLLASFETVKRFKILPNDFSEQADELTPTLKVKRKAVCAKYQDILDSMYPKEDFVR